MGERLVTCNAMSVAGTALTGTLANVGTPTTQLGKIIYFINGCNQPVSISWDGGSTTGFILPGFSSLTVDGPTNRDSSEQSLVLPIGAQFQAKHNGVAPTSGVLSISIIVDE